MMSYGELMKVNKARYAWLMEQIEGLEGLSKMVAETLTAKWIKGRKWEGGLGNGKDVDRMYEKLMDAGYSFEEIDAEFERQMDWVEGFQV